MTRTTNRMDCRPIQFRKKKYPKNTSICREDCRYWLVCQGKAKRPKRKLTKSQNRKMYQKMWYQENKERINLRAKMRRMKLKG